MGDNAGGGPAQRAILPPSVTGGSDVSGARLTPRPSERMPESAVHAAEADWSSLATAPTLLLTPIDGAGADDAISTSRIATSPPIATEDQPWFRTGATLAPPSMRPTAESVAPAPPRMVNPRVLKAVFGVLAACLFIVLAAGLKLVYKRFQAPATPTTSELLAPREVAATDVPKPPAALESTVAAEHAPGPPAAAPSGTTAAPVPAVRRSAPARPSPVRTTTKVITRHAPVPKKTSRGSH